ncbi:MULTISPECIES: hypothetical protein [unclassified Aureispira]|uniref:hypothetical protein n=1 Tax=unclassified Aureispira TaxID=2649989 RepID=UPI000696EEE3|nr:MULTISPECIES: hypothetical protein [unclassified Aureispira]WMX13528.1 hypothetical protein QP953_22010 [Aureispira sp. CCB-E]
MMNTNTLGGISLLILIITFCSCRKTCNDVEQLDINCHYSTEYKPVCGCNGKTYTNSGHAECYGIETYTEGACL